MAWGLSSSPDTASFYGSSSRWSDIGWSDLQPGDAAVRRNATKGHIVLFVSWTSSAHTAINTYEEYDTGIGTIAKTGPSAA